MKNKKIIKTIAVLSSIFFYGSGNRISADIKNWFYIFKIIKSVGKFFIDMSILSRNWKVGMNNLAGGDICYFRHDLSPLIFSNPVGLSFFDIVSARVVGVDRQLEILKKKGTKYINKKIKIENNKPVWGPNNIGILMHGPSGCGKSLLATVFAHTLVADGFNKDGSINKNCKSVYRLSSASIDLNSPEPVWSQLLSEKKMVQKNASVANNPFKAYIQANPNGGVIIFDEFDKIYNSALGEGFRNIIERGKIDLDGIIYNISNYVFIFTTNASPSSIKKAPNPDLLTPEEEAYGYIECKFDKSFLNRLVLLEFQPLTASSLYSIFYNYIESWNNTYNKFGIKLDVPIETAAQIGIYLEETCQGGWGAGNLFDTLVSYLSIIELLFDDTDTDTDSNTNKNINNYKNLEIKDEQNEQEEKNNKKNIVIKIGFDKEKKECFISEVLKDGIPVNLFKQE